MKSLPQGEAFAHVDGVDKALEELEMETLSLRHEIAVVDEAIEDGQIRIFLTERTKAAAEIRNFQTRIAKIERQTHADEFEIIDLENFLEHLSDLSERLPKAQISSDIIGSIEFTHCPACLAPLDSLAIPGCCSLCSRETDPERERSRYLEIKLDLDIQIRESRQLLHDRKSATINAKKELRRARSELQVDLSEFAMRYEFSDGPRESYLAKRHQRIGQINGEISQLFLLRERADDLERLSAEKALVQAEIGVKHDRQKALISASALRRKIALTRVSEKAKSFLRQDLDRQQEFRRAQSVEVNFRDNSILVDGDLNFAESSNVVVKNSVILALLAAATEDEQFLHPRFLLMDNIEDKGMEEGRSHNFQELIVRVSETARLEHQIIFTTSKISPELEDDEFTIGPSYTHERRTLRHADVSGEESEEKPLQN